MHALDPLLSVALPVTYGATVLAIVIEAVVLRLHHGGYARRSAWVSALSAAGVSGRLWGVATHVSPKLVGRHPRAERWVITPSLHRVHHGKDRLYLDTNYGEVLSLWDRLFGSFQTEHQAPTYGVRSAVDATDFTDIQVSPWRALWRDVSRARRLSDELRSCFYAPGWSHDGPDKRVAASG